MIDQFKIKVGQVKNLAEARFLSSFSVDLIGFCFDKEDDAYISPIDAQEIMKWLEGPKIVGEFGKQSVEEINEIVTIMGLEIIQIPQDLEERQLIKPELEIISIGSLQTFRGKKLPGKYILTPPWENVEELADFCKTNYTFLDISNQKKIVELIEKTEPAGLNLLFIDEADSPETKFDLMRLSLELLEFEL